MKNLKTKRNEILRTDGFTIIEVMIVLAVAGLILLIVLLAVPALQRSGRNTAIRNDASALAAGINEFESNNNGTTPTKVVDASGTLTLQTATITSGGTAKIQGSTTVNGGTGTQTFAVKTQPVAGNVSAGALYVDSGEGCQSVNGTAPTVSNRSFGIYYWTETPGVTAGTDATTGIINGLGLKGQCVES